MLRTSTFLLACAVIAACQAPVRDRGATSAEATKPGIAKRAAGLERLDGFLPVYWDAGRGQVLLEIAAFDVDLIHVNFLAAGLGSNDVGLDRGKIGATRLVHFERHGPKVLMVQPNLRFRAAGAPAAERAAVLEAFAPSVLWSFPVEAETAGRVLVDATAFLLRDVHGVADTLRRSQQGKYRLDLERSVVLGDRLRAFPDNVELEALLTFVTDEEPGSEMRQVAPSPKEIGLRVRQSFVRAPDAAYVPRRSTPGAGYFTVAWADYAVPIGEPLEQRMIVRHRLEKRQPGAAPSPVVEPIVYYLDPGTPEPVRSALLDGARWWAGAFEAAGFRDAYHVEMLPDGADPLDVRYNVIQWVHRATRGWSYGASVVDPRTGEILKGHVSLGSLRVRQDYLLAEGLLLPHDGADAPSPEARAMALARLRQLAAHEVGHTLGLSHNYAASAAGRASVMDYPHPRVGLDAQGLPDLSQAYAVGMGEWDKVAISYGYAQFDAGADEETALTGLLVEARRRGLDFLTDQDARPPGSAHPQAHLWDDGADAAAELRRVMDVRRTALARFDVRAIRPDQPLATLEEALVPLYYHHRYQIDAAAKLVGGMDFRYALRGDGQQPFMWVPAPAQLAALQSVLAALAPEELAFPSRVLELLPPRPATVGRHRELFPNVTLPGFDAFRAPAALADQVYGLLLDPRRAARLVQQHALHPELPSLEAVLAEVLSRAFGIGEEGYAGELQRLVQERLVRAMLHLAAETPSAAVAARTEAALYRTLGARAGTVGGIWGDHFDYLDRLAQAYRDRPFEARALPAAVDAPPGSPIGSSQEAAWSPEWGQSASWLRCESP